MPSNYKHLGDYIQVVNIRNKDLENLPLMGLSVSKVFFPTIANLVGTDMSTYKVVYKNQFTYIADTSRRGDKIAIALNDKYDKMLVSQAYTPFEVIYESKLLPEYLMMWFRRPEFDRYARFKSHGSAREIFDWDEMCETLLPIPTIEKQQEIVREYNTIQNRIALNNQLISKLEETAQAIYKQWFVDFEFPFVTSSGVEMPYKSNGGKMIWCEELEKEIPEGWEVGIIGDLFIFQRGHDLPYQNRIPGKYPIFASTGITGFHNEFKSNKPTIITGRSGSLGELVYCDKACWPLNTTLYIVDFKKATPFYSFCFLKTINLKEMGAGSAVPTLNRNDIHRIIKEIPQINVLKLFDAKISKVLSLIENYKFQSQKLEKLNELLLAKMTKIKIGMKTIEN